MSNEEWGKLVRRFVAGAKDDTERIGCRGSFCLSSFAFGILEYGYRHIPKPLQIHRPPRRGLSSLGRGRRGRCPQRPGRMWASAPTRSIGIGAGRREAFHMPPLYPRAAKKDRRRKSASYLSVYCFSYCSYHPLMRRTSITKSLLSKAPSSFISQADW